MYGLPSYLIFPSSKSYTAGQSLYRGRAGNFSRFQSLNREEKLGIFLSPRAYNYREGRIAIFPSP